MAKYVRKGKKGGRSGRPYVRRSRKASAKGNFKKRVLDVMRGQVETKEAYHAMAPTYFNSFVNSTGDLMQIIPSISKGVNDNNRLGDQLRPQKLKLKAIIQMLPQDNTQSNSVRRIWYRFAILTPKPFANLGSATTNFASWAGAILKKGGTTTGLNGDIVDYSADFNHDMVTVHYQKKGFMNQGLFYGPTTNPAVYPAENCVQFFDKTFTFGKNTVWKYDDAVSAGLVPSHTCMVGVLTYGFVDGTAADSLSSRVLFQYTSTLEYEDA
jgi:hypothetical protein